MLICWQKLKLYLYIQIERVILMVKSFYLGRLILVNFFARIILVNLSITDFVFRDGMDLQALSPWEWILNCSN